MSAFVGHPIKDPQGKRTYTLDWEPFLAKFGSGVTIAASSWTVPSGIVQETSSFTGTTTSVQLSGGTLGASYDCVNHVTLSNANADETDRTIRVTIRNK